MEDIFNQMPYVQYIRPAIYFLLSLLLALIFKGILLGRLKILSKKSRWQWDDVVIKGLGRGVIYIFLIGGAYLAINELPADPEVKHLAVGGLFVVLALVTAMIISGITEGFIGLYSKKTQGGLPAGSIFNVLAKILIFTLALLVVLQTYGISVTPVLATLGVGGLAVALALQDTLSNLFAGIQLIASKKFRPGDYIEMEGVNSGFVEDISWRNTTIKTPANNLIIIPNSRISSAIVTNYSKPKEELSVPVVGGVAYGSDLEKVEKVIAETAKKLMADSEKGVNDYEPLVRFNEFGASGINFTVGLRAREYTDQFALKHEFIKALHKRFKEEGMEFPYPQMDVHMDK